MELYGFVGIGLMVLMQIIMFAFGYGKISQKVSDLCKRVEGLEKKVNNTDTHLDKLIEKIARIEGRLQ